MPQKILLDVPYVTQMKIGAQAGGNYYNDTKGCWYAAICMLAYYQEQGPRMGVPDQMTQVTKMKNEGGVAISQTAMVSEPMGSRYAELMENEGLTTIPLPPLRKWTGEQLCQILTEKGPCYIRMGFLNEDGDLSGGHAVVLVGCNATTKKLTYHCPMDGPKRVMTIQKFNDLFKWTGELSAKYSMMYMPKNARGSGSASQLLKKWFLSKIGR